MIHNNLLSADPPPGGNINYPGTDRLGNNSIEMPGIQDYAGTENNPGPFDIQCGAGNNDVFQYISHPKTRKKYHISSKMGKRIINNYLNRGM